MVAMENDLATMVPGDDESTPLLELAVKGPEPDTLQPVKEETASLVGSKSEARLQMILRRSRGCLELLGGDQCGGEHGARCWPARACPQSGQLRASCDCLLARPASACCSHLHNLHPWQALGDHASFCSTSSRMRRAEMISHTS